MAIVKERILLCLDACSTFTSEPRSACGRFHILDGVLICLSKKRQQVTLDSDVSSVFAYTACQKIICSECGFFH